MLFLSINLYDTPELVPLLNAKIHSSELLKQECIVERLKLSFRNVYGQHGDLIYYEVSLLRILSVILKVDQTELQ